MALSLLLSQNLTICERRPMVLEEGWNIMQNSINNILQDMPNPQITL